MKWSRLFFGVTFLVFVILTGCAYYNTLFNAKKSYNEGIEIIQSEPEKETHPQANKFFEQTIEKCWKLIELYSDQSKYADDALLYIIKSEYHMNRFAQARSHMEQFLLKYPESDLIMEANLWYGKLYLKEDEINQGREYLNKVINLSSDSKLKAEAYYELGNLAYQNHNYENAISFFEKALKEKVDEQYAAFINYYLGESYFQQEQYEEAIKKYQKVEKFSPSLDVEYKTKFNMGKSYAVIGKYDRALSNFRKMLTAPRFKNFVPLIKTEIANTLYRQEKQEEAIELYKEVVKEKVSSPGTALASLKLGKIYEYEIQNIDSAVHYYGLVRSLYARFDSVEIAQEKFQFLSELKSIKDQIKRDRYLIFKLENDKYFRDSLYTAQYEDSILNILGKSRSVQDNIIDSQIDTSSILYKLNIVDLDSIKKALNDTLQFVQDDSVKNVIQDSLDRVNRYLFLKAPKTEKQVEKRKLPEIKEDLKNNQYHLAEFFLLNMANYDSALSHYQKFLKHYDDSLLTPKAIYSLHFIYSQSENRDLGKQDSLEQILKNNYPDSPFTRALSRKEGKSAEKEDENQPHQWAENMFQRAEQLYFQQNVDSALALYETVATFDTSSMLAAKARYARAWIYENELRDYDKAISEYKMLKENYQPSDYTNIAERKIRPVSSESGAAEKDTSQFRDNGLAETAGEEESDDKGEEESIIQVPDTAEEHISSLPFISKTKDYREWRQKRARSQ